MKYSLSLSAFLILIGSFTHIQSAKTESDTSFEARIMADTLVAMEKYDLELHKLKDNPTIYEEYGFHFMGHCYGCDAVDIYITDSHVQLIGACTKDLPADSLKITGIEHTSENVISVKTTNVTFIFEQIEDAPIYKLTVKGKLNLERNQTIYLYFSPRSELHKFKTFDCGEFDG